MEVIKVDWRKEFGAFGRRLVLVCLREARYAGRSNPGIEIAAVVVLGGINGRVPGVKEGIRRIPTDHN